MPRIFITFHMKTKIDEYARVPKIRKFVQLRCRVPWISRQRGGEFNFYHTLSSVRFHDFCPTSFSAINLKNSAPRKKLMRESFSCARFYVQHVLRSFFVHDGLLCIILSFGDECIHSRCFGVSFVTRSTPLSFIAIRIIHKYRKLVRREKRGSTMHLVSDVVHVDRVVSVYYIFRLIHFILPFALFPHIIIEYFFISQAQESFEKTTEQWIISLKWLVHRGVGKYSIRMKWLPKKYRRLKKSECAGQPVFHNYL